MNTKLYFLLRKKQRVKIDEMWLFWMFDGTLYALNQFLIKKDIQATMKFVLLLLAITIMLHAEILPFDNSAVQKIFEKRQPALFLLLSDENAEAAALSAFSVYDSTNPNVILSVSSKNDGNGLYERLSEFLGMNSEPTPSVLYLNAETKKYRYVGDEITAESLANFLERVTRGEIEPFLKSAPIPEDNEEAVKVVVGKSFRELISDSPKEVLVKFYAPWCGHCKQLAPHFDEAAKKLANNPNILLAKVDSTENEIDGLDIQGYPTVKFWRKDKSAHPLEFNGERTADGIVQWLKEHTEYEWVEPVSSQSSSEPVEAVRTEGGEQL